MRLFHATFGVLTLFSVHAETIISVPKIDGLAPIGGSTQQYLYMSWTSTLAFSDVTINAWISGNSGEINDIQAYLGTVVGPGASAASPGAPGATLVGETLKAPPSTTAVETQLFSGLSLPANTYYLVLAALPIGTDAWSNGTSVGEVAAPGVTVSPSASVTNNISGPNAVPFSFNPPASTWINGGYGGQLAFDVIGSPMPSCASIVDGGVHVSLSNGNTAIHAAFTPNFGLNLSQAAAACGFTNFDWQQNINLPYPRPDAFQSATGAPLGNPIPDPPPGGWAYQDPPNLAYPLYWDPNASASDPLSLAANEVANQILTFVDNPADSCLPGGQGIGCNGMTATPGSIEVFQTQLMGILPDGEALPLDPAFTWSDSFNGTSGGISVTNSYLPVDPGSGSGDITILSTTDVTTVPEPSTVTLGAAALLLVGWHRVRKTRRLAGNRPVR